MTGVVIVRMYLFGFAGKADWTPRRGAAPRPCWSRPGSRRRAQPAAPRRRSARPAELAAGLRDGGCRLVALDDVGHLEEILRVVALPLGVADVERGDELVVAGAVVGIVRHECDLGRQLETAERLGELDRVERLLLVGDERAGPGRDIAEPGTRGRHLAGLLPDGRDEVVEMGDTGLLPVPFEDPGADARLGRQALERLELLLGAGKVEALVEAELQGLFERVDHVVALHEEDHYVRVRRLRLDEIGGEV